MPQVAGGKQPPVSSLSAAPLPPTSEMMMNGTLGSDNCGMVLSINVTYVRLEEYYAKAVNYTLMITIISFVQVQGGSGLRMGDEKELREPVGTQGCARGWAW